VLFYSYSDALKGRHMIATSAEENNTAREVVENNLDALNAMVGAAAVRLYSSAQHHRRSRVELVLLLVFTLTTAALVFAFDGLAL
jgi:hypothetical protein